MNILLIPCHPIGQFNKSRPVELIRQLASTPGVNLYVLNWLGEMPPVGKIAKSLVRAWRTCKYQIKGIDLLTKDNVSYVQAPIIIMPPLEFGRHNQHVIKKIIRSLSINVVINETFRFMPVPDNLNNVHYIYDLVDDIISDLQIHEFQAPRKFVLNEIRKASSTWAISRRLCEQIFAISGKCAQFVPNGVNLEAYRQVNRSKIAELRRKYSLGAHRVISFIGNYEKRVGLDFLLEAFKLMPEKAPGCRLLIVGPIDHKLRKAFGDQGSSVIFTGAIPSSEIIPYFQLSDIGVVPFEMLAYTHNSHPLKILEYGAARKKVVCSPLQAVIDLNLPFVSIVERDPLLWAEKLAEISRNTSWDLAWDDSLIPFHWKYIINQALEPLR